jgi:serine/threonine protein kinase
LSYLSPKVVHKKEEKAVVKTEYGGWEKIEMRPLGAGGQSEVFLVRSPERVGQLRNCLVEMDKTMGAVSSPVRTDQRKAQLGDLAKAFRDYSRPEEDSEFGALKVFKNRGDDSPLDPKSQEVKRLKNEIDVLRKNYPGLPKLLASSESEFWIVTEYFRTGSLEKQIGKYENNPLLALTAFRSLVKAVTSLHDEGLVHRDIKPANVFIRNDQELILGDLGIVFVPNAPERPTETNEKVGPSDYMAPWLHSSGARVADVKPSADVYMLGKLLWCMVSGRLKLFREDYREAEFNLERLESPHMERINLILDECVVAKEQMCLRSATELLTLVDATIRDVSGANLILPNGDLRLGCVICGKGTYKLQTSDDGSYIQLSLSDGMVRGGETRVRAFVCNVCTHHAFFAVGYPKDRKTKG